MNCTTVFYNTDRSAQLPTTLKSIVLYNTDVFPKLIYCASWLNGAPAKDVFRFERRKRKREAVVFHILCRYSHTLERANGRLNQREKSVRTVKYIVPAQIAEHASRRN